MCNIVLNTTWSTQPFRVNFVDSGRGSNGSKLEILRPSGVLRIAIRFLPEVVRTVLRAHQKILSLLEHRRGIEASGLFSGLICFIF